MELTEKIAEPGFWDDPERAQKTMEERGAAEKVVNQFASLQQSIEDMATLIELGREEGAELVDDELKAEVVDLSSRLDTLEFQRMLGGEQDESSAILSINAGAGGTEAQDWASMILRMYQRFCDKRGWKTETLDYQSGDEAGIKGATLAVRGAFAYGHLKAEAGVHRLVRISPYDSSARRHTSFASVFVTPEIDDDIEIDINETDLRIDTYRASGAGGQHVNRTDSAVRITHEPTGIVVQCQNERSQHKNKATAMKLLRARLYELELRKREEAQNKENETKLAIDFGSQIRSYVLHPYQMIKDTRTEHETSATDAVLDGDLQPFIEAFLLQYSGAGSSSNA